MSYQFRLSSAVLLHFQAPLLWGCLRHVSSSLLWVSLSLCFVLTSYPGSLWCFYLLLKIWPNYPTLWAFIDLNYFCSLYVLYSSSLLLLFQIPFQIPCTFIPKNSSKHCSIDSLFFCSCANFPCKHDYWLKYGVVDSPFWFYRYCFKCQHSKNAEPFFILHLIFFFVFSIFG